MRLGGQHSNSFKIMEVPEIEPKISWLVVRQADHSASETVIPLTFKKVLKKSLFWESDRSISLAQLTLGSNFLAFILVK